MNNKVKSVKAWQGRFDKPTNRDVEHFLASIHCDKFLFQEDIIGSAAHVKMLHSIGLLTVAEANILLKGLRNLIIELRREQQIFDSSAEDIHMAIESMLRERIGSEIAGKLHTARSRNDQVATDLHLWMRSQIFDEIGLLLDLQTKLVTLARDHSETYLPGYTHLQRAQPIVLGFHLMAYANMFSRDIERLQSLYQRINIMPLGAGALAGTTFPIDRFMVSKLLKFDAPYENSLDAVSDRDFVVEAHACHSLLMIHLSRFCEELILWSSHEFQFVEMDDSFSTGSSIMPQKKNPDVAELIRGKSGRVIGALTGMLITLKSLPLAYNKDMQEDKEGIFDSFNTVITVLRMVKPMLATLKVNTNNMAKATQNDFSNATDLADYLVSKGIPFREAHEIVGKSVRFAIIQNKLLLDLTLDEYLSIDARFTYDLYDFLKIENVVSRRKSFGGTAPKEVIRQIDVMVKVIQEKKFWLNGKVNECYIDEEKLFALTE
jgi:argininosuccinate lyase